MAPPEPGASSPVHATLPTILPRLCPVLPAFCHVAVVPGLHACLLHLLSSGKGNNLWNSRRKPGKGLGRAHGQGWPPWERLLTKA